MMQPAEIVESARGRSSLWLLAATVVVSLLVRESYPFSHFPMYSRFRPGTWYVYVSNTDGDPLPSKDVFRISTPKIKKILRTESARRGGDAADSGASEEAAARAVLEMLAKRAEAPIPGLQLWRVDVRRVDDTIERQKRRVALLE